jgi:hypothetical protein
MKKRLSILLGVVVAMVLFILPVAGAATIATGLSAGLTVPGAAILHQVIMKPDTSGMAKYVQLLVQKEIWIGDIIGNLFKNNQFLNYAVNEDEYVLAGKVVHIPQAGAPSSVQKNRTLLPATVNKRTDSDITYPLDEYTSDPRLIPDADTKELSYDKRNNATEEDQAALRETVADTMLINWAPTAATTIRTSGTAVPARMPGQTGNRNAFTEGDLRKAMTLFNAQNIPQEDRYCILDAYMYDDFIASLSATIQKDFSRYYDAEKGIIGKLHTFNIIMRSNALVYNAAATAVNAYGAAVAVTDNCAALCWHARSVSRAFGDVQMFDQNSAPTFYGDVFSFLLRAGGRIRRADAKGVVAISQI